MNSKRQRKVFASNSQVCHVWAQQTQDSGRSSNIFFEGPKIYSYGYHYLAAQIHIKNGKRFALMNSHRYSNTTTQHLSQVRNALSGLMPYFECADVTNPKAAVKSLDADVLKCVKSSLKRMKITDERSIAWEFECIRDAQDNANKLREFLGLKPKFLKQTTLNEVETHLRKRLKRYNELNTPEMRAKRKQEAAKRQAKKDAETREKLAEDIKKWRANATGIYNLCSLPHELLRIRGDVVETSRGATVPLVEAKRLFTAIKNKNSVIGANVGDFTVNDLIPYSNDEAEGYDMIIKIGCHRILWSEAQAVLGGVM